jgi:hypothetical protein
VPAPPPDSAATLAAKGLGKVHIHKLEIEQNLDLFNCWALDQRDRVSDPRRMALKTSRNHPESPYKVPRALDNRHLVIAADVPLARTRFFFFACACLLR